MKNVLIISSSPRKGGNSDLLCDQFAEGAKAAKHTVEKIFLKDKKIAYCNGCMGCMKTKECVISDDMTEVLDKMVKADVIVFATPIYFYNMTGQLKTFIDRCCPKYEAINNKVFYMIMTAYDGGRNTTRTTLAGLQSFLDCLNDCTMKESLFASGMHNIGDVKSTEFMQKAFDLGKDI